MLKYPLEKFRIIRVDSVGYPLSSITSIPFIVITRTRFPLVRRGCHHHIQHFVLGVRVVAVVVVVAAAVGVRPSPCVVVVVVVAGVVVVVLSTSPCSLVASLGLILKVKLWWIKVQVNGNWSFIFQIF